MARPRRLGQFVPLSSNYYADDAVIAAGERAEVLFARSLAWSAQSRKDGKFTDRQVAVFGIGLSGLKGRIDALVREGLWERIEDGYRIRSWLKWNKSVDEIDESWRKDRERKKPKDDGTEPDSDPNPNGFRPESDSHIQSHRQLNSTTELTSVGDRPVTSTPIDDSGSRPTCTRHPNGDTGEECGGCAGVREWDERQAEKAKRAAERAELDRRRERAKAIANCPRCHGSGWIEDSDGNPVEKCDHRNAIGATA